ncbi:MAG: hypothetical protein ABGX16_04525 [Pirellulales bacterium]
MPGRRYDAVSRKVGPLFVCALIVLCGYAREEGTKVHAGEYRVAPFEADITIPIGHACMGGCIAPAKEIVDPLFAKGCVLLGTELSVVVIALDRCRCNNDSYDRWRDVLADAAGTTRQRVMLSTVHQHDAPTCDLTAQKLLDRYGLTGYICGPQFHERAVQRTAAALKEALKSPRRVTHFGIGQAKVDRIASNRRVVSPKGEISWRRGSSNENIYDASEGEIDPWLKTISLWDIDDPVVAWSCYAVHPMSFYGRGGVSADFPGMARVRRQQGDSGIFQIYFTGCAGDTTAGKYNTSDPANRPVLADRLYQGVRSAWESTKRQPLKRVDFRIAQMSLPVRQGENFTVEATQKVLADPEAGRCSRINAARMLSWRRRVESGQRVDVPCLDLSEGMALFSILRAESFVAYQLIAQQLRPDSFVVVAGYGDGGSGCIPTDQCWKEGYRNNNCWVPPMTQELVTKVMAQTLGANKP